MGLVLRFMSISPRFTNPSFLNIQNVTVARAKTLNISFKLVIGGGVKFKILKLFTVAPAKIKIQMRTSDW